MKLHEAERIVAADVDRETRLAHRIASFHPWSRAAVARLMQFSPQLADLADSFPALLFALATGYATRAARERTILAVALGAPLGEATDCLGLPLWLRRLPAAALKEPLPRLPDDKAFASRIIDCVPRDTDLVASWLATVACAAESCGAEFALWAARQPGLHVAPVSQDVLVSLAAWAWFSGRPDLPAYGLVRHPWRPELGLKRALEERACWLKRLALDDCLRRGCNAPWAEDGDAFGYEFHRLVTIGDFIEESGRLENCLELYARQLRSGRTCVYAVRNGGRTVACIELGPHDSEPAMPAIEQLKGPRNRRAPDRIWRAAFAWLANQPPQAGRSTAMRRRRTLRRRTSAPLWQPFLDRVSATPWEQVALAVFDDRGARAGTRRHQQNSVATRHADG